MYPASLHRLGITFVGAGFADTPGGRYLSPGGTSKSFQREDFPRRVSSSGGTTPRSSSTSFHAFSAADENELVRCVDYAACHHVLRKVPYRRLKGIGAFIGGMYDGIHIWMEPYSATHVVRVKASDGSMQGNNIWPLGFSTGSNRSDSSYIALVLRYLAASKTHAGRVATICDELGDASMPT